MPPTAPDTIPALPLMDLLMPNDRIGSISAKAAPPPISDSILAMGLKCGSPGVAAVMPKEKLSAIKMPPATTKGIIRFTPVMRCT